MRLRNEAVFVDFLYQLENGARPCDLVRPPFEDEKDTKIRELKEEMATKNKKISELEIVVRQAIGEKDELIQKQKEVKTYLLSL